ncbi:DUF982 domain-containing protein [Mesorhizobium sp. M0663]|uniref:DUF982 domain-containing protein n=1 Tax=unclassified Mesorhizobium TaxID=325217 RepID=UPI00333C6C3C
MTDHDSDGRRVRAALLTPMATHWFVPLVFVKTETGDRHGCDNARAALEQLKRWTRRGPRWHKAVTLCLSDLEGDPIDPQVVRRAFEAAAEAKMYLSPHRTRGRFLPKIPWFIQYDSNIDFLEK